MDTDKTDFGDRQWWASIDVGGGMEMVVEEGADCWGMGEGMAGIEIASMLENKGDSGGKAL
jgi:hypothetical protein